MTYFQSRIPGELKKCRTCSMNNMRESNLATKWKKTRESILRDSMVVGVGNEIEFEVYGKLSSKYRFATSDS